MPRKIFETAKQNCSQNFVFGRFVEVKPRFNILWGTCENIVSFDFNFFVGPGWRDFVCRFLFFCWARNFVVFGSGFCLFCFLWFSSLKLRHVTRQRPRELFVVGLLPAPRIVSIASLDRMAPPWPLLSVFRAAALVLARSWRLVYTPFACYFARQMFFFC